MMPTVDSLDTRLERWLDQRGLRGNPFAAWNAELEPDLPRYFVDVQQFDELLRLTTPCVVFARRGCGKTAQRQMLAAQCRPHESKSTRLAIHYTFGGFEHVLGQASQDVEQVQYTHHINTLLHLGRTALTQEIASGSVSRRGLVSRGARSRLAAYMSRFAPHLLPTWLTETPAGLDQTNSVALLQGFAELLKDAGLEACLVLVDGLDEFPLMAADPAQIVTFLAPLLGALPLVECPGLAFKFFLPAELEPALRAQPWFRTDRLRFFHITWDKRGLLELIKQRLTYFSQRTPPYEDLGQLCEDRLNQIIGQDLVALAGELPRAALILADMLLQRHCQQADPPELIALETWEQVKAEWQVRRADFSLEEARPIFQHHVTEPAASPVLAVDEYPLLRVEENGLVRLGEQDITNRITAQDHRVLACLFKYKDGLCSQDLLAREAWLGIEEESDEEEIGKLRKKEEEMVKGVTDQAIAASIARLRRALGQSSPDKGYIETVKGRGYRLYPGGFKAGKAGT